MLNEIVLASRYKLIKSLAKGAFGDTYVAKDTLLPGQPKCVVKKLNPQIANDEYFQIARRLFKKEAEALHKLGHWDRIPTLYAFFEEGAEFYLVQQYIRGYPLTKELIPGCRWLELDVIHLLRDVSYILEFIHSQSVIHRDIKPSNLIRRQEDNKLVLVDFGAVKEVIIAQTHLGSNITIGIGTKGYMPPEQLRGKPRFNSDVYALGMIGIQALTGINPTEFKEDEEGELLWHDLVDRNVDRKLVDVLLKMTRYHFQERYQSAREVIIDIEESLGEYINEDNQEEKIKKSSSSKPVVIDLDSNATLLNYNPQKSTVQIGAKGQGKKDKIVRWCKKNSKYIALGTVLLVATIGIPIKSWIDYNNLQRKQWREGVIAKRRDYSKLEKNEYRKCLDGNYLAIARKAEPSREEKERIAVNCQMTLAEEAAAKQYYFRAIAIGSEALKSGWQLREIEDKIERWYKDVINEATKIYQEEGDLRKATNLLDRIPKNASVKGEAIDLTIQWGLSEKQNKTLLQEAETAIQQKNWQRAKNRAEEILENSKSQKWQESAEDILKIAEPRIARELLESARNAILSKEWKKARVLAEQVKDLGGSRARITEAEEIIKKANENIEEDDKPVFECLQGINCAESY